LTVSAGKLWAHRPETSFRSRLNNCRYSAFMIFYPFALWERRLVRSSG